MDRNLALARRLASRFVTAGLVGSATALALPAHADGTPAAKAATAAGRAAPARPAAWIDPGPVKPNGSGIRLRYTVASGLQPGQTAIVQLEFSGVRSEGARAEWRAPVGTAVSSTQLGNISSISLPRGQSTVVSLQVTPSADGMAYLDVFTTQGGRGTAQSVPIAVGSGKVLLQQEGVTKVTPSGEKVISLPSTPR